VTVTASADENLSIVVVGASGDLARRKIFPALFALYCQGFLPRDFHVFGFARSAFSDEEFRAKITERLACRYAPGESCADRMAEFLGRCHYVSGQYGSADSFLDLYQVMREKEGTEAADRLFYLSIPPSVFMPVARAIGDAGLVSCTVDRPWSHVVIEKPFGMDRESSDKLTQELAQVFNEHQTYRIDHYLGKEVIQNLMILRFANLVFEPLWNREYIEKVVIEWAENLGVEGRGGYFDQYGIVRDVMQNHLLQILALAAMERPRSTGAGDIRDEKVRVLKAVPPVGLDDIVLGQYVAGTHEGRQRPGYTGDESVPGHSVTATYAAASLRIDNDRWRGVPFIVTAGKALGGSGNTVTVHFRHVPGNIFCDSPACLPANKLVIRIQPDEAITLRVVSKEPGLDVSLAETDLDVRYQAAFSAQIPDAYERLLMDVIQGDKSLFIRADELEAAWDIFTPVLQQIEERHTVPEPYPFGSDGPAGAARFLQS